MSSNLIEKLLRQHMALMAVILEIKNMSSVDNPSYAGIETELKKFGKLMIEHLYLENNVIYKKVFDSPMNDLASVLSAENFIKEMESIQREVVLFLETYNNENKIKQTFETFKVRLNEISKILDTRIKLEEEGLFNLC